MEAQSIYLLIAAGIIGIGFFFAPQLLRFRILVLRKLRLNWFADLHSNHFEGWVTGIRVALAIIIVMLLYSSFALYP